MTIYGDIETELGATGHQTEQGDPDSGMTIDYVNGLITLWSDITDLLTLPADYEDLSISLLDGATVSVYGFDAENTVIYLNDDGTTKWCHCFKYADATDYGTGKTLQTPAVGLRV